MGTPIEGIGGPSDSDRIDMIRSYMGLDNVAEQTSSEFSASNRSDLTSVSDSSTILEEVMPDCIPSSEDVAIGGGLPSEMQTVAATEDNGNAGPVQDSDGDGVLDHLDVNPSGDGISPGTQALLDAMFTADADGDGILDFIDRTGSETQTEQLHDEGFEPKDTNVRAFISLMSMLSHLDLTRMDDKFTENGDNSLASMAIAGMAQVAIMHSARLQEPLSNVTVSKQDIKKSIEDFNNQTKEEKLKTLINLAKIIDKIPMEAGQDLPLTLPQNVRKAIEKIRPSLPSAT
ncbi:MAG: hypothetical protein LBJ13_03150 [Puniceicoccales bacterium]|jgi:hypothetical protein|nr:hypothetical protein [Puniceicoccales bacterium]